MCPEPCYVFVYGSLMEGFELHDYLVDSELICRGEVKGKLIGLDGYPGLLDGEDAVHGEVYRFDDPENALNIIDGVERFDPSDPTGSLFLRVVRPVTLSDGTALDAWMYLLNRQPVSYQTIPNGDWRAFVSATDKLQT